MVLCYALPYRLALKSSRQFYQLSTANSRHSFWVPHNPTQTKIPLQFLSFSSIDNPVLLDRNKPDSLLTIRASILQSALDKVHHHGWTDDALAAGTASVREKFNHNNEDNMSLSVVGLITVDDLIAFCMDQWNVKLQQDLEQKRQQAEQQYNTVKEANDKATIHHHEDALEAGIKTRLQYIIPYLQSHKWHEGMALGIRGPSNAFQTQQQLKEMIEIIVVSAKLPSTLGLTQKMALGAIYVMTELHLLTDTSPDYSDTWAFLSNRMDDWRRLMTTLSSSNSAVTSDVLFVGSSVASSLLGGLVSLVMQPNQASKVASFGLPDAVWSALFQSSPWDTTPSTASAARKEGTHPRDYDAKQS
jgi:ubiquinone biosynthesis protein COQ9